MHFIQTGVLTERELELIIKEKEAYKLKSGRAGLYSNGKSSYNDEVRSGLIYFTKHLESKNTINILQSHVLEKYYDFNFNFTNVSSVQYVKYGVGDKFKWHQDIIGDKNQEFLRSFTMSVNLSKQDDYTGGDLLVRHNNKVLKLEKEAGSYIIFPSFLFHQACEVKTGEREAIVVWTQSTKEEVEKLKEMYYKSYPIPAKK